MPVACWPQTVCATRRVDDGTGGGEGYFENGGSESSLGCGEGDMMCRYWLVIVLAFKEIRICAVGKKATLIPLQ